MLIDFEEMHCFRGGGQGLAQPRPRSSPGKLAKSLSSTARLFWV